MTPEFTAHGKQVLHNGEHFADARDDETATVIVDAMQMMLDLTGHLAVLKLGIDQEIFETEVTE